MSASEDFNAMSDSEEVNAMSASEEVKTMKTRHPSETDLALLAGGDCGRFRQFQLNRHVSRCGDCQDTLASFTELRSAVKDFEFPDVVSNEREWARMAAEMRANIRLGLAAGECVGEAPVRGRNWVPQFAFGAAGVLLLAGAGVFLHGLLPQDNAPDVVHAAELVSNEKGVEVRSNSGSSMTLLNHGDVSADQTVTSQGAMQSSYVDGGAVTVARVYGE